MLLCKAGKEFEVTMCVDDDQSGDMMAGSSHTGAILFINSVPIIWYYKRQSTI